MYLYDFWFKLGGLAHSLERFAEIKRRNIVAQARREGRYDSRYNHGAKYNLREAPRRRAN